VFTRATTDHYPERKKSSPARHILLDSFQYSPPIYDYTFEVVSFARVACFAVYF